MIDFRALASSSDGCCYLVGSGTYPPLLLDAGLSHLNIQRALGFSVSTVAGVLLSHAHGDHCRAVKNLAAVGVDIYAHEETWKAMGFASHRTKTVQAREAFKVGPWSVMPFEAVHDMPGTLGFVIDAPAGGRLLYLTDTAYSRVTFGPGLTHLAVECNFSEEILRANTLAGRIDVFRHRRTSHNHMSLERLLELLAANDLTAVEEIHLLHLSDENSDEGLFRMTVQRATGKPVIVAPKSSPLSQAL